MSTRMQQRRGTSTQWTATDPVLASGEIGFETDTNQFKMGDGTTRWSVLSYFKNFEKLDINGFIADTEKGAHNGVASLDSNGQVPVTQLQNLIDGAPGALDTLKELSAALDNDANFASGITTILYSKAPKNNAALTGTPTAPTATALTNTTQIATTAFVTNAAGTVQSNLETAVDGISSTLDEIGDNITSLQSDVETLQSDMTTAQGDISSAESSITSQGGRITTLESEVGTLESSVSSHGTRISTAEGSISTISGDLSTAQSTLATTTSNYNAHAAKTTSVHGIADTSALATKTYADSAASTAQGNASNALSTHNSATTSVHGIADTSLLVTTTGTQTLTNKTLTSPSISSPAITGTPTGITKTHVGLGNVDNTADTAKPVSTAQQTALDLKANLAGPTFTGTVVLPTTTSIGSVTGTEHGYLSGVTSAIQTQLDAKLAKSGGTMSGAIAMGTNKITGLGTPSADADAATKAYVDAAVNNINIHESVLAATTTNGTLSTAYANGQVIDGVTLATGNRILIKNQTTGSENGIYTVNASGAPTRATDYDLAGEVSSGDFIFVRTGTTNANTGWIQTANVTTVGTDSLTFTQFSGAGAYTAGTGLTLSGTTFSINTATTVDLSTAQTLSNKTFVAPVLGAATATSINGTSVPTSATLVKTTDKLSVHAATSSAELAGVISDETGTGALVFANTPTLVTPVLGVATATSINGTTIPSSKTLVTTADTGTVTSTMILDGTIVDADINASAAIAQSKIANLTTDLGNKADKTATITSKTASYTLASGDQNTIIEYNSASAGTFTIPTDNSFWTVGQRMEVLQVAAGQITIAGSSGVTVNGTPGLKTRTQWSGATIIKRASNVFVVVGDLSA